MQTLLIYQKVRPMRKVNFHAIMVCRVCKQVFGELFLFFHLLKQPEPKHLPIHCSQALQRFQRVLQSFFGLWIAHLFRAWSPVFAILKRGLSIFTVSAVCGFIEQFPSTIRTHRFSVFIVSGMRIFLKNKFKLDVLEPSRNYDLKNQSQNEPLHQRVKCQSLFTISKVRFSFGFLDFYSRLGFQTFAAVLQLFIPL